MKKKILSLLPAAFCLIAALCLVAESSSIARHESDQARSELQRDSFSSLSWSLAEFRVDLAKRFDHLMLEVRLARKKAVAGEKPAVDANQLADLLEDTVLEAQQAVPVEGMQESILVFYRVSGLTNRFLQLYADLQRKNINRFSPEIERTFLAGAQASQHENQNTATTAPAQETPRLFKARED
jgi:hypothetical protein